MPGRQPPPLHPDHLEFAFLLDAPLRGGGSHVWSPYSVGEALGLVATGARGTTRAEMEALLGSDLEGHLTALSDAVEPGPDGGPELESATSLWIRGDMRVDPAFERRLAQRRTASVRTADFAGDPEGVRKAANAEIAEVTHGLIPHLLQPGDIAASTDALLFNALWARLEWTVPFPASATAQKPFHAPSGTHDTAMMRRQGLLPYAEADGWTMVTLESSHDLALDVLLPPEGPGADRPAPTAALLTALHRSVTTPDVRLALPRFELTTRALLATALDRAGVRTVFTPDSELTAIADGRFLIDEVVHQARLRVDERGAEGAAATAVTMRTVSSVPSREKEFTADRPFAFVLRRRGAVLFLGTVTDPEDPGPAD